MSAGDILLTVLTSAAATVVIWLVVHWSRGEGR